MIINLYVFVRVSVTMNAYIRMSSIDDTGFETALLVEQSREILGRLRWYPFIYTLVRDNVAVSLETAWGWLCRCDKAQFLTVSGIAAIPTLVVAAVHSHIRQPHLHVRDGRRGALRLVL
jgi:hypothetical protein